MASGADLRGGLVIPLVQVATSCAGRSVRARRLVRRHVAARALGVSGDRVKRGKRGRSVAGLAPGRNCDAARPVGAMTRLAASRGRRVRAGRLVRVTRGAGGDGLPRMWFVTAFAALVTRRCRPRLDDMTRAASRGRCGRVRHLRAVAGRALGVTLVRGNERGLARVAVHAQGLRVQACEVVRPVASLARHASRVCAGIEHGDLRMAACARGRDDREVGAMRLVAGDARSLCAVLDLDVLVATDARGRGLTGSVRRVAARADRVGRHRVRSQRGLLAMTADASPLASGHEVVFLVATDAGFVTRRMRSRRLCMARRACLRGGRCRLVRAVTVETPLRAGVRAMLRRALVVAARAIGGDEGWGIVGTVAFRAFGGGVLHDGGQVALQLHVTADARRSGEAGRELVAGQARCRGEALATVMRFRRLLVVALRAHVRAGVLEPVSLDVVAVAALRFPLTHVKRVPGARAVLGPCRGNEAGRHSLWAARPEAHKRRNGGAQDHDRGDEAPDHASGEPRHRPIPWQLRHGRSRCSFLLLAKPGPWGLPPGPPTR
jgi:hypothetical protein